MNERIRTCAEQANEAFYQRMGEGADRGTFYFDGFAEKFAELIVQECNKLVVQYINDCGEVASLPDCILKDHFGIGDAAPDHLSEMIG